MCVHRGCVCVCSLRCCVFFFFGRGAEVLVVDFSQSVECAGNLRVNQSQYVWSLMKVVSGKIKGTSFLIRLSGALGLVEICELIYCPDVLSVSLNLGSWTASWACCSVAMRPRPVDEGGPSHLSCPGGCHHWRPHYLSWECHRAMSRACWGECSVVLKK